MTKPQPFTKKPVTIQAMQWTGTYTDARYVTVATDIIDWITRNGGTAQFVGMGEYHPLRKPEEIQGEYNDKIYCHQSAPPFIVIDTLEGPHRMALLDWAIMGVEGEFYSCQFRIFNKTYNPGDASKVMPLKDANLKELFDAMELQMDLIFPGWRELAKAKQVLENGL